MLEINGSAQTTACATVTPTRIVSFVRKTRNVIRRRRLRLSVLPVSTLEPHLEIMVYSASWPYCWFQLSNPSAAWWIIINSILPKVELWTKSGKFTFSFFFEKLSQNANWSVLDRLN
jgi:hypothetical protein